MDLRRLGTIAGVRGTAVARARRRLRPVDDGRVPIVPTRIMLGEVIATVAVAPSARGDVVLVVVAVLQGSRLIERLSAISSRRSAKGCVVASLSARQELKDQMQSRKSTKTLLKAAIAAREKAVIKLEGLQKEEMDLTQVLLLKQQEISDAKSDAAEKAREVETLQARRLAEVDCEGSVSHVSSSASCSAPLSPQQWALGLAASLPEDLRVKFEEWYSSVEIEAKASVDPYSEVLSQGSPATLLPANPVSSTPGDIYRFRLPCCQGSFPLSACNAICCGVSGEQESGAAAGSRSVRGSICRLRGAGMAWMLRRRQRSSYGWRVRQIPWRACS